MSVSDLTFLDRFRGYFSAEHRRNSQKRFSKNEFEIFFQISLLLYILTKRFFQSWKLKRKIKPQVGPPCFEAGCGLAPDLTPRNRSRKVKTGFS